MQRASFFLIHLCKDNRKQNTFFNCIDLLSHTCLYICQPSHLVSLPSRTCKSCNSWSSLWVWVIKTKEIEIEILQVLICSEKRIKKKRWLVFLFTSGLLLLASSVNYFISCLLLLFLLYSSINYQIPKLCYGYLIILLPSRDY